MSQISAKTSEERPWISPNSRVKHGQLPRTRRIISSNVQPKETCMTTTKRMIPSAEGQFDAWARNFVHIIKESPDTYRVDSAEVKEFSRLLTAWDGHYAAAIAARDNARAATTVKDESRHVLEETIRNAVRRIQADNRISNHARAEAGLPIHKTRRTPVAIPKTSPIAQVIASDRLEHSIMFSDASTPTRKARPTGCTGAEIYIAITDHVPQDPSEFHFTALATRTPHVLTFKGEDGGKLAHYLLRWINTKGKTGPWGQVASATIPAV